MAAKKGGYFVAGEKSAIFACSYRFAFVSRIAAFGSFRSTYLVFYVAAAKRRARGKALAFREAHSSGRAEAGSEAARKAAREAAREGAGADSPTARLNHK
jgi:hypothetical protein